MSKDTIVNEMRANLAREREGLALVRNTARGAFRVFETVGVVGRQGLGWLLGDREALGRVEHFFLVMSFPQRIRMVTTSLQQRPSRSLGRFLPQGGCDTRTILSVIVSS